MSQITTLEKQIKQMNEIITDLLQFLVYTGEFYLLGAFDSVLKIMK